MYLSTSKPQKVLSGSESISFGMLAGLDLPIGYGGVVCLVSVLPPLSADIDAITVGYL